MKNINLLLKKTFNENIRELSYYNSSLLNQNPKYHTVSAIHCSLEHYRKDWEVDDEADGYKDLISFRSAVTISDCNKVISLDFDFESKEELKNSINKCEIIINQLNQLKRKLEYIDSISEEVLETK